MFDRQTKRPWNGFPMPASTPPTSRRGPSLHAIPFMRPIDGGPVELLSEAQRQQLARISTVEQFGPRTIIYRAGGAASSLYIIGEGALKSYRDLPSGRRRIAAFLFARDIFGLAKAGRYVNTVQAMTPVMLYKLEFEALADVFKQDSELELRFLCKAVHELREAQHHTIIVGRRLATGRVAMLLHMLERNAAEPPGPNGILVPMTRSDMADYVGLSLEAVVRAIRRLERQGILQFVDRHHVRILDRHRFEALAVPA